MSIARLFKGAKETPSSNDLVLQLRKRRIDNFGYLANAVLSTDEALKTML